MPTLFLIDGHALAYRAYFALTGAGGDTSRWMTKGGEPTAGTYGFINKLMEILEKDKPEYLAVSFDIGRTFRDDLFAEYKGTREKMPDELHQQIERIKQVVAALNIPVLTAENYEADDVLGTISKRMTAQGVSVIILTGDRDLLQLAADGITVRLPGRTARDPDQLFGPVQVQEKTGVTPQQFIDYKALVGDTSDNIPGVSGIGEKTATKLLQDYGTLDGIYANLEQLAKGVRAKLEAGKDNAYLSQKLSAIVTNVPIEFDLETARPGRHDPDRVLEIFRELEFNSLLKRVRDLEKRVEPTSAATTLSASSGEGAAGQMGLFSEPARSAETPSPSISTVSQTTIVRTADELAALVQALNAAPLIAFDTETTGTDPMQAQIVGISLAVKEGEGYYIPVGHAEGEQLPLAQVIEALTPAMTNTAIPKTGHNCKYDYVVLKLVGLTVSPLSFDTMLAEFMCDPGSHALGLKKLALLRLGVEMQEIKELLGTGKKQITMERVAVEQAAAYAAADADVSLRLVAPLREELVAKNQLKLFTELEMPLVPILAEMEMAGVALDVAHLAQMSATLEKDLARLEQGIYEAAGKVFNVNSPTQLADVLFGQLNLKPADKSRKTASGKFSTAADVLEELRGQHPIIELILEQRELSKLKSTYVDALPQAVNPRTGRVHTSFNQAGAVTGRIASSDPNLQNIPIRSELGRQVRRAFVAAPKQVLVSADYSQIELRLAAHVSQDPTLIAAFMNDEDIHATTAAKVLGVPLDKITKDQRRQAKSVNFGLLYGMGAFALARQTGLTLAEAENFVKSYFERFPGVKRYLDETKRFAADKGFVETLRGRRRYFPQLAQSSFEGGQAAMLRARAEREAINAPIQGTAADIIKQAMLELPAALREAGLSAKMLLQVHDELLLECPPKEVAQTAQVVRRVMESAMTLSVPLGVEVRQGKNWDEMKVVE